MLSGAGSNNKIQKTERMRFQFFNNLSKIH